MRKSFPKIKHLFLFLFRVSKEESVHKVHEDPKVPSAQEVLMEHKEKTEPLDKKV